MNTIIIKKIYPGNYLALCEGKHVASITKAKKTAWVVINRLGHVRVFPTLSASKTFLERGDLF